MRRIILDVQLAEVRKFLLASAGDVDGLVLGTNCASDGGVGLIWGIELRPVHLTDECMGIRIRAIAAIVAGGWEEGRM